MSDPQDRLLADLYRIMDEMVEAGEVTKTWDDEAGDWLIELTPLGRAMIDARNRAN